jgi:hypothetical protein
MNRKSFIMILLGIFFAFKKRISSFITKDAKIPEDSLKTNKKLLG